MFRYTKLTAVREVAIWVVTLLGLLPFYFLIATAFKTDEEALTTSALTPPSSLDFSAFVEVLTTGGRNSIPMSILNSVIITAGAIAGLGGVNYVLGYKQYYEEGFAAGAGFLGIAVALVGRNHPLGVPLAALLFATISQGGLAVNAIVPKQMVEVLTAVVIIAVAATVPEVQRLVGAARRRVTA